MRMIVMVVMRMHLTNLAVMGGMVGEKFSFQLV